MIMGDSREAAAEIGSDVLEVRLALRISTEDQPSVAALLEGTNNALRGALTALGVPGVDAAINAWHQTMTVEAQEEF